MADDTNPFLLSNINAQQGAQLRASTSLALDANPDAVGKTRQQAAYLGIPTAAAEALPEETGRRAAVKQIEDNTADTPVLRMRYTDESFGKVAHDDSFNLSEIEKGLRVFLNGGGFKDAPGKVGSALAEGVKQLVMGGTVGLGAGIFDAAALPLDLLSFATKGLLPQDIPGMLAADYRGRAKAARGAMDEVSAKPEGNLAKGIQSGLRSTGQNLAMLPLGVVHGAEALVGALASTVGAQAYSEARGKGMDAIGAMTYALPHGVFEYAFEKLPALYLLDDMAKHSGFMQIVKHQLISEVPGEQATTLLQNFNDWARLNPEKTAKQFIEEVPDQAAQTLVATLVGMGAQTGIIRGTQKILGGAAEREARANEANSTAANLGELFALATGSKLRERDPASFADFVQTAADQNTNDGTPGEVFVDGEVLAQSMEAAGITPEQLAELAPATAAQLAEATPGGDVAIPVGELVGKLTGTGLETSLLQHLRASPEALSQAEAQEATAKAQEFMQAQAATLMADAQQGEAVRASGEVVRSEILGQLAEANRFTKDVNEAYAKLVESFYVVNSQRLGMSPEQLYAEYPLQIGAERVRGDSVSQRQPGTWFHGTTSDVRSFDRIEGGNMWGPGYYLTDSPETASGYAAGEAGNRAAPSGNAGPNVMPVRVAPGAVFEMAAPLTKETIKKVEKALGQSLKDYTYPGMKNRDLRQVLFEQFTDQAGANGVLQKAGYLGLSETSPVAGAGKTMMVFDPGHISSDITGNAFNQSMSTRLPSGMKTVESPLENVLPITFDVVLSDEPTLVKNLAALMQTPNMRRLTGKGAKGVARQAEAFVDHVVNNLLWLHDHMPAEMRDRARKWYDGGRKTIEAWATRYGISEMQGAAAIAVLSPQNGWYANVSQAERIADMVFGLRETVWDEEMTTEAHRITDGEPDDKMQAAMGKTLGELLHRPEIAARWVRVYDQTHNNRAYRVLTPEGGAADYVKTGAGNDSTMMWKSYATIGKAISVLTDGRAENVYYQLGKEHKVRNFYNNLFAPNSEHGFATIDTHAVAAALLRPLSSSDIEVGQAFGGAGSSSSNHTGLNGTYPIYLEAYRRASAARGILPREMQSITWEAVRGLFEAAKKSGLKDQADAIWLRYKAGEIEQEAAQQDILALAGDITPPSWTEVPYNDVPSRTYEGPAQQAIDARGERKAKETPSAKVFFEVAPDPNDAQLTTEWNALDAGARLAVSQEVAAKIVPKVLAEVGSNGDFVMQLGGYLGATNPSMTLRLTRPELTLTAAKLLGHALAQDSMMVVTETQVLGSEPVGAVTIELPAGYGEAEITALYNKLWELEDGGEKLVGGHTTADGRMVILNYTNLSTEALGQRIHEHLGDAFAITGDNVYSAFPSKEDYGYGLQDESAGDAASRQSPAQRRPDSLRREATELLREALDARRAAAESATQDRVGVYEQATGPVGVVSSEPDAKDAGAPSYGVAQPGSTSAVGVHFSKQPRSRLDSIHYGSGARGLEAQRLAGKENDDIRPRTFFYVDKGNGIQPEDGVGGYAHRVQLDNLYDAQNDPLGLVRQNSSSANAWERAILRAGFDGYLSLDPKLPFGFAVLVGKQHTNVPVEPIAKPGFAVPKVEPETIKKGLMSREIAQIDVGNIPGAALKFGTLEIPLGSREAANAEMERIGSSVRFSATLNQGPRGTYNPAALTISLLQNADLSTFLHETGHFFLDTLGRMADQRNAPPRMQSDMAELLVWFGVKDLATWNAMTLEQQRPHHEKFAESFEQYLFEGRAPNTELSGLFGRFRAWLTNVYRSLQDFVAGRSDLQLSDEVRGVMDRLLATDEQIAQAEEARNYAQAFDSATAAGMTPAQWAAYQALGAQATQAATEQLQRRSLRDMRWLTGARSRALRELQKDAKAKRTAVEAEVRAEVEAEPVYQAQAFIEEAQAPTPADKEALKEWKGKREAQLERVTEAVKAALLATPDAQGLKGLAKGQYLAKNKKASANVIERQMIGWEQQNPKPKKALAPLDADIIGERFGFKSGDEMMRALAEAQPVKSVVEGMTDQRMLERYGDLATQEGVQRAADEAVHNDARAKFVATELAALNKKLGKPSVIIKAAKDFAARLVGGKKIRDLKPGQHSAAETRAAKKAQTALAKGDSTAAATAKRDQILSHYAARETNAAITEIEKAVAYLTRMGEGPRGVDNGYQDQIDKLLERFDLRTSTTLKEIDRRASLAEWLEEQADIGIEPDLPAAVLQEAYSKSYKELTVDEFRGLVDSVRQLEHLGRLKDRLLTAKNEREFKAVVQEIVASIEANGRGREADTRTPNTVLGGALVGLKKFWSAHVKSATWARVMDGGKDGGPVWEYIIRPANYAGNKEIAMRARATQDLAALLKPVLAQGSMGGKGTYFASVDRSLNREALLAIALNTGNESNLQRLLGGEGWNLAQIDPLLKSLTLADWQFVQKVWDYFVSYRPEIAAKEKRVSGKEPVWLDPAPREMELASGDRLFLRGGYYPVKYDARASERAEAFADAEGARAQMKGAFTSATTRRSFTKTRAEEVNGRPLLYSLDGLYNGVNEVIHDLSWHEFLIDANRLVKNKSIAAMMRSAYGPEAHQQFKSWLQDVAAGEVSAHNAGERALGWVRQGVSISGLGFNIMSALIQPFGITQSIVRIGPKWVGKGMAAYIAAPLASVDSVFARSAFMKSRAMTRFRELAEVKAQVKGRTKAREMVDGGAYYMMLRAQQMVDIPTWLGAYEKAIVDGGNNEERAIALADQAVIDAQGSGMLKDLSAIERGGPAQKLFTVFYSFFNTALNLGVGQTMTTEGKAKLAADYLLLFVVPVVLGALMKSAVIPGDSGDWEDPEKIAKTLAGEEISYLFGLMFGVREVSGAAQALTGTAKYGTDYSGPAGLRPITDLGKLAKQVNQGEADDALRKAIINTAGELLRLPAAQINRSITGAKALADGKTQNPAAIVMGYQEPH